MCSELEQEAFIDRHRLSARAFTRNRKLPFTVVFILILRNSVKSLQLMLNEFVVYTQKAFTVTAGAFTRARRKLKHTAYVELNENIIKIYYKDNDSKRWHGFRVLAFDGSKMTLPETEEIKKEFGVKPIANQTGKELGEYAVATFECCYDVLNYIAVKSTLATGLAYEANIVEEMLADRRADDLLLFDRGYASYSLMAKLITEDKPFIIRCTKSCFAAAQYLFEENSPDDLTVLVSAPAGRKKKIREQGLPLTSKVRFIKVRLASGEIEVLATSLLNEQDFAKENFSYLYSLRWGVETYFSKVKGRLALENFTGKTVESIYQDFWSTILISNLETILTEEIEEEINETKQKEEKKKQKINKAVSFNVIKNMAFDLFFSEPDKEKVLKKMTDLFMINRITVREDREVLRKKISHARSLNFQKRKKKYVF